MAASDLIAGLESPRWVSWLRLAVGIALVLYGATSWARRGSATESPAWLESVQHATPKRALRLGLLLSAANPKIIALGIAGGLILGGHANTLLTEIGATLVFALVGSLSVAAPLAALMIRGDGVMVRLRRLSGWLERNNSAVMAVVLSVIGVLLIVNGAKAL